MRDSCPGCNQTLPGHRSHDVSLVIYVLLVAKPTEKSDLPCHVHEATSFRRHVASVLSSTRKSMLDECVSSVPWSVPAPSPQAIAMGKRARSCTPSGAALCVNDDWQDGARDRKHRQGCVRMQSKDLENRANTLWIGCETYRVDIQRGGQRPAHHGISPAVRLGEGKRF